MKKKNPRHFFWSKKYGDGHTTLLAITKYGEKREREREYNNNYY